MLPKLFFAYFAFSMVLISILIVTRKNPVHSVLWMLLLFFHIAGLYLFLNAEFLAAIQVIVYAGAILVLFLFVIFLLNLKEEVRINRFIGAWSTGFTFAVAIFVVFVMMLRSFVAAPAGKYTTDLINQESHIQVLGKLLYTDYLFPFEVASLVLLVAIVGAIVLAKKRRTG
ncbi:MAG: NADH-quinone oxidoreductase subunit J [Nitrospirota bacterium]